MPSRDIRARQVAYLLSLNYPQNTIATILESVYGKIAESTIAADKVKAENNGWLRHIYVDETISDEQQREVVSLSLDYFDLTEQLIKKSNGILKKLYVCYSGESPLGETQNAWDAPIRRFATAASMFLERVLAESSGRVGVAWGTTVAEVVQATISRDRVRHGPVDWKIVPTSGEPLGQSMVGRSSSDIAGELAAFLGPHAKAYSLKGVFPVIPEELISEVPAILKFFARVADFEEIFAERGLVNSLDTFITSVGSFEQQWMTYGHELVRIGGKTTVKLKAIACGDIGGALIARDESSQEYRHLVRCWTGINLASIRRIAHSGGGSGVVVLALGQNKAAVLLEAIQRGLVTCVVCDHHLAKELGQLLGLSLLARDQSASATTRT